MSRYAGRRHTLCGVSISLIPPRDFIWSSVVLVLTLKWIWKLLHCWVRVWCSGSWEWESMWSGGARRGVIRSAKTSRGYIQCAMTRAVRSGCEECEQAPVCWSHGGLSHKHNFRYCWRIDCQHVDTPLTRAGSARVERGCVMPRVGARVFHHTIHVSAIPYIFSWFHFSPLREASDSCRVFPAINRTPNHLHLYFFPSWRHFFCIHTPSWNPSAEKW